MKSQGQLHQLCLNVIARPRQEVAWHRAPVTSYEKWNPFFLGVPWKGAIRRTEVNHNTVGTKFWMAHTRERELKKRGATYADEGGLLHAPEVFVFRRNWERFQKLFLTVASGIWLIGTCGFWGDLHFLGISHFVVEEYRIKQLEPKFWLARIWLNQNLSCDFLIYFGECVKKYALNYSDLP